MTRIVAQAGRRAAALAIMACIAANPPPPHRPAWPAMSTAPPLLAAVPGLAQRLRDGTRSLHTATERAGLMPALLRGQLPAAGFHRLLLSLHGLYAAMEPALARHADEPWLKPLALAPLFRRDALAADLAALLGPDWATTWPPLPALQAYVDRLRTLDDSRPGLLAAHAYVRYLGDLSGGQTLARIVRQAYGMTGTDGTRFYDFGPPAQVAAQARRLREALDALPVDEAGAQALVAEAQWSFAQHERLFHELAPNTPPPPT
jgi:heme oxygenase